MNTLTHVDTQYPSLILYYRPDFDPASEQSANITDLEKLINHKILIATNWPDLVDCLTQPNIKLLLIHGNAIKDNMCSGPRAYVKMIETMLECEIKTTLPSIAFSIDNTTSCNFVGKLRSTSAAGVVPSCRCYSVLESAKALEEILKGNQYWPENVINSLPDRKLNISSLPLHVYFRIDQPTYVTPEMNREICQEVKCRMTYCFSLEELPAVLEESPQSLIIHVDTFKYLKIGVDEFIKLVNTLMHCINPAASVNIGVAIEPTTSKETVAELIRNNVLCISPSYGGYGKHECTTAIKALLDTGKYIPKNIIYKLPSTGTKTVSGGSIRLTERQEQVLALVCKRGLSNKKIASTLKISESTVKIHISAILKEYGVRNRTQLALAASSSLKA